MKYSTSCRGVSAARRHTLAGWAGALALAASALHLTSTSAAESAVKIPAPAVDDTASASNVQTAVFAGGCFWGVQGVFQRVNGVVQAVSGYAGGAKETAQYEMVGSGLTGHAESVKITYDPKKVSYGTLLQIYFSVAHDPTQLNRQDPDSGPQYRSAVFYADPAQKQTTERYIAQLDAAKAYPKQDRHPGRAADRVLSGRGLSPGLPDAAPRVGLHRPLRPAQGRQPEEPVPAAVPRRAGAGDGARADGGQGAVEAVAFG